MADPVMSNLPLRRVLDCVLREYQTRGEMSKAYNAKYPMEGWIRFSNALRRRVFSEVKEREFDEFLQELVDREYVENQESYDHPERSHERLNQQTQFYRLTEKGRLAKLSVKRRS